MKYKVSSCIINNNLGKFEFYCFSYGNCDSNNVLVLKTSQIDNNPILRIQSACFTSEIFGSKDCDCHEQLIQSIQMISENNGLLIYLLQDGRGAGIFNKIKGMQFTQELGIDTAQAYDKLGINRDPREYSKVVDVLNYFLINSVQLLTNNPRKINGLEASGIKVLRLPLEIKPTPDSLDYLKSKKQQLGHLFSKYI